MYYRCWPVTPRVHGGNNTLVCVYVGGPDRMTSDQKEGSCNSKY